MKKQSTLTVLPTLLSLKSRKQNTYTYTHNNVSVCIKNWKKKENIGKLSVHLHALGKLWKDTKKLVRRVITSLGKMNPGCMEKGYEMENFYHVCTIYSKSTYINKGKWQRNDPSLCPGRVPAARLPIPMSYKAAVIIRGKPKINQFSFSSVLFQ